MGGIEASDLTLLWANLISLWNSTLDKDVINLKFLTVSATSLVKTISVLRVVSPVL